MLVGFWIGLTQKSDEIAKLIPFIPGRQIKLDDAVKEDDILSKRVDSEEETKELFMYAKTRRFDQKCRYSCWWSIDSPWKD